MLDVLVILDRSGSMQDAKSDHEGGLKSFVEDQKALAGEVRFTLIQFDTVNACEVVYDRVPLDAVDKIELVPRSGTPLLDAVGQALDHLTKHQPTEVVCMVITDGQENSSKEWTRDRIKARVAELETKGWSFLFLGANVDAFAEAGGLGMAAGMAMAYAVTGQSVGSTYASATSNLGGYRALRSKGMSVGAASNNLLWTNQQRAEAAGTTTGTAPDPNYATTYGAPTKDLTPEEAQQVLDTLQRQHADALTPKKDTD